MPTATGSPIIPTIGIVAVAALKSSTSRRSAAEVPLKAAAPITRQRGHNPSPDCNERRMANAKLSSQDLMPVLDQASRSAR